MSTYTTIETDNIPALVTLDETRETIVVVDETREAIIVSGNIGPKGDPGETTLGNKVTVITNLQDKDLLQYNAISDTWINVRQTSITDGGTF